MIATFIRVLGCILLMFAGLMVVVSGMSMGNSGQALGTMILGLWIELIAFGIGIGFASE